ncbi:hypothetical protein ABZ725_32400 [Streptomyces sp. NPDC006872]|uniref:hypothetical protein n=1 Tax=Streptomyces sp. NPDC006872 TaxID=3155720 RepID=UPI0033DBF85B
MTGEEPRAPLGRTGLETAEHPQVENVPPTRAARHRIASAAASATVAAPADRPVEVDEADEQWHRLAVQSGLFDEDGVRLREEVGHRAATDQRLSTASTSGPRPRPYDCSTTRTVTSVTRPTDARDCPPGYRAREKGLA